MTANDSKSSINSYLQLLNYQINTIILINYHHSSNKKPNNADYSALIEKNETNRKANKF